MLGSSFHAQPGKPSCRVTSEWTLERQNLCSGAAVSDLNMYGADVVSDREAIAEWM